MKNKKGGKYLSVYWFAILFIVAAGIVYMVISFYGEPYDIRESEANILTGKVARCLSEAGYLRDDVLGEDFKNNFQKECKINFNVEDIYNWRAREQYYVEVTFYDFLTNQTISSIKEGNRDLKQECSLKERTFPFCLERNFYSLDKEGNQYKINILSVVRKTEKNVQ